MDTTELDTVVIGAGAAGLHTARLLAERGIDHQVIDAGARVGDHPLEHRLVTLVHSVEVADRDDGGTEVARNVGQRMPHLHGLYCAGALASGRTAAGSLALVSHQGRRKGTGAQRSRSSVVP